MNISQNKSFENHGECFWRLENLTEFEKTRMQFYIGQAIEDANTNEMSQLTYNLFDK